MDDNAIFIGKDTSFNGTITAKKVTVEGLVEGEVVASENVFVKRGGVVNGSISTQKFLCEEGGQHNGLLEIRQKPLPPKNESKSLETQPSKLKDQAEDLTRKEQESPAQKPKKEEDTKRLW